MSKKALAAGMTAILMSGAAPAIITDRVYLDNDLTNLIPDLYAGLDVVSRELVGMVPSSTRNSGAVRFLDREIVEIQKLTLT